MKALLATAVVSAVGALGFASSAIAATFPADAPSLGAVPDHVTGCDATGASPRNVTFTVTGMTAPLSDVTVGFTMSPFHPWTGDIEAVLIAPNAAQQTIFGRTGAITATSCGDSTNLAGPYTFSDTAAAPPNGGWWQTAALLGDTVPMTSGTYRATAIGGLGAVNPQPPIAITPAFAGVASPNGVWTLRFSDHGGGDVGSVSAATLSLTGPVVDVTPPAAPALTGTNPPSPADNNAPKLLGSAEAGSQIKVYETADCSGPSVAGSEAELEAGIGVSVADNTTTSLTATATDAAANVSSCSSPITYTEVTTAADKTPPETQLDKAKLKKRKATFSFSSPEAGATFQCQLDQKPFAPCTSPTKLKHLKPGKHVFSVEAIDAAGNIDASAAAKKFKVKKRKHH